MTSLYEIVNCLDGKRYIGIARDPDARRRSHEHQARVGRGFKLHAAMRKHGPENFEMVMRAQLPTDAEAKIAGRIAIALELPEYNLTAGGDGVVATPDARAKLAAKAKGRKHSEETRAKIRVARALQTNVRCGPFNDAHRAKLSAARKTQVQSAETRAKRSASLKQAYASGLRASRKGAAVSVETRAKLSEAGKRAWAEGRRKRGS